MGLGGEELLVALAEAEEVEAGVFRGLGVADEFADALLGADPGAGDGVRQMVAEGIDPELQPLARVDAEPVHHIHGIGHGVSSVLIECHLPCQLTGVEDYSRPFDRCQKPRCWPSPGCGPLPCGGPSSRSLRLLS